jgi:DNA (cytosine-5)-methyltransferase 1
LGEGLTPFFMIIVLIVDLFCGAGGVTEGFEQAQVHGVEFRVLAGVNHDAKAIQSHTANHPKTHHFIEDLRDFSVVKKIASLIKKEKETLQKLGHTVFVLLHASLECTNFSNAKGGKPRDGDSRSLADCMPVYINTLSPDYFTVENVREFMSWGPLDEKGKPISRQKGKDYVRWTQQIESIGYTYSHRLMNAADYGAYTSRLRYYALFSKNGLPVAWPHPTHTKTPQKQGKAFGILKKWMPVRDVLDLSVKGESIFNRKKPLVEKTLERIYAGLIKHVAKGDATFLQKHYSGNPNDKCISLSQPAGTLTTTDSQSVVSTEPFMMSNYSGKDKIRSRDLSTPCPTLTTAGHRHTIVQPIPFVMQSNGGLPSAKSYNIDQPSRVITSSDNQALVQATPFMMTYYSGSDENRVKSLDEPCLTVTTENRHAVVSPEFLLKYHGNEKGVHSTDDPCSALTTKDRVGVVTSLLLTNQHKQDKAPVLVVSAIQGSPHWEVHTTDSPATAKVKHFMREYNIGDIYMRMLMIPELLKIQGFPSNYILKGNSTEQKKFIGNSVVPAQMKAWAEALGQGILNTK